jgi:hypothetical protein
MYNKVQISITQSIRGQLNGIFITNLFIFKAIVHSIQISSHRVCEAPVKFISLFICLSRLEDSVWELLDNFPDEYMSL